MSADSSVRQRAAKNEDKEENIVEKVEEEDHENKVSVFALVAQFLVGLLIVFGSIYSQLEESGPVKPKPIDKGDPDFVRHLPAHIYLKTAVGNALEPNGDFWVRREYLVNTDRPASRNCLARFPGHLIIDDLLLDDVKDQVMTIALYMLDKVGKKGNDHRTIWDLYFNTLTYPGWDVMTYRGVDQERDHQKYRPELPEAPEDETKEEADKRWAKFKQDEQDWVDEFRSFEGKPGSALDIFEHHSREDNDGTSGAAVWSPSIYDHAIPALMQNVPHALIKTFKGNGDFFFTWPLPFIMHHAAEEDEEPAYTRPYIHGSGSNKKKFKSGKLPHVDYAVIWFLSDAHKGGDLVLHNSGTGKNVTIEARHNRAVMFTTGSENTIKWQKVTEGKLVYAMLHFSCEKKYDMSSNGKQGTFLPYGPLRAPETGVQQIFVDLDRGLNFGLEDPRYKSVEEIKQMDVKPLVDSKGDIDESVVREEDDDEEDIVIDAIEG